MKGVTMPKPKKTKPNVNQYILDYEPCGRDEAEILQDEEAFKEDNPDYDPEDHWISIQTDIARGK